MNDYEFRKKHEAIHKEMKSDSDSCASCFVVLLLIILFLAIFIFLFPAVAVTWTQDICPNEELVKPRGTRWICEDIFGIQIEKSLPLDKSQ